MTSQETAHWWEIHSGMLSATAQGKDAISACVAAIKAWWAEHPGADLSLGLIMRAERTGVIMPDELVGGKPPSFLVLTVAALSLALPDRDIEGPFGSVYRNGVNMRKPEAVAKP